MPQSSVRRTMIALSVTVIAVAGLVVARQARDLSSTASLLREQANIVLEEYRGFAQLHAISLSTARGNADEQRQIESIVKIDTIASKAETLEETLDAINMLQIGLRRLVEMATSPTLRSTDSFKTLATEVGEHGDVREALDAFNLTAKHWNEITQGQVGTLSASVTGHSAEPVPLLRFDGHQEYMTIIEL